MMNAYTCNLLRNLLAECFDYAMNTLEIEPSEFISIFIKSDIVKEVENGNPKYSCGIAGSELCEIILYNASFPFTPKEYVSLDRTPYYWTGYYLGYYKFHKNFSFAYIFSFISIDTLLEMYPTYHEMDETKFCDELDRLNKQKPTRLSILRKQARLSQSQLSSLSGVPLKTIQAYEQKEKDINKAEASTIAKLLRILDCSISDILEQ